MFFESNRFVKKPAPATTAADDAINKGIGAFVAFIAAKHKGITSVYRAAAAGMVNVDLPLNSINRQEADTIKNKAKALGFGVSAMYGLNNKPLVP